MTCARKVKMICGAHLISHFTTIVYSSRNLIDYFETIGTDNPKSHSKSFLCRKIHGMEE